MIIDSHIHLWGRLHADGEGFERRALGWGLAESDGHRYYAAPPSFEKSLSTWELAIAHFDWLGIDRAVVLQEFIDGKQDDYLAQVRRACPGRFSCTALLDRRYLEDPTGAFEQAIERDHLQGFLVLTPSRFPEIAIPKLMPMWRECSDRGLPVILKNGDVPDVRRLADACPDLKIVLSHLGGKSPERWALAAGYPNVFMDTGGIIHNQGRYPWRSLQEAFKQAVEIAGAHKIMWGTDYPRLMLDASYRQQLDFVLFECEFLSEEQRRLILGETASRVYCWDEG